MNITIYIIALLVMGIIDAVWLFATSAFYKSKLGHLFAETPNFVPAIIFYLAFIAGLTFFVLTPALQENMNWLRIFLIGAFFGFICYATYDLTNHAVMKAWPVSITLIDLAWGTLLTGAVSLITVSLYRFFF